MSDGGTWSAKRLFDVWSRFESATNTSIHRRLR